MADTESKFIDIGKSYGHEGSALEEFVEKRLSEVREREERAEKREMEKMKMEQDHEQKLLETRGALAFAGDDDVDSESADESRTNAMRSGHISIPRYDGKQTVKAYLELFEDIARQNKFSKEEWLIRLRVAVAGTSLDRSCMGCESYEDAKRELLAAHGTTPSKLWKSILAMSHQSESFYQYVGRLSRAVYDWIRLASEDAQQESGNRSADTSTSGADVLGYLVKQIVLESCSPEQKAFMLERKAYKMKMVEFLEAGVSFQSAHEQKVKSTTKSATSQYSVSKPTSSCLTVNVKESEKKLASTPMGQRREYVMEQRLCWNCLKPGHRAGKCFSKPACNQCNRRHHPLLHGIEFGPTEIGSYSCGMSKQVRLMTGVAEVCGSKKAKVRVFIDPGSQASFVSQALVKAIQPTFLEEQSVRVKGFGSEPATENMPLYRVKVTGRTKSVTMKAWQRKALDVDCERVSRTEIRNWEQRGCDLSDQPGPGTPAEVHLLIGADYCNEFLHEKRVVDGCVAWSTELGWMLSGPSSGSSEEQSSCSVSCVETHVESWWKMDEVPHQPCHVPDFPLLTTETGYQVGLLWKSERRPADNYAQAMAQAQSLIRQLKRNGKRDLYDSVLVHEYLELDAIEVEPHPDTAGYYMPHHAVFRESASTTKTRVVFNASATSAEGESLNDILDPGPSLLPTLAGLLLRFREYECAFQADIRKAFFMISMCEEDRQYLRFLWPKAEGEEVMVWRLKKLPFGVNCSPFILSAVLSHHLVRSLESCNAEERAYVELLLCSFYVDDCISSLPKSESVSMLHDYSISLLQRAGLELRKWRGNTIPCDPEAGTKALGLVWDTSDDVISIAEFGNVSSVDVWSRRVLLSCVVSVFDPLGFASAAVLPGKLLLQESWKIGGEWDDPLPKSLASRCVSWWEAMPEVSSVQMLRWIGFDDETVVDLHVFADASEKGYGCCIYGVHGDVSSLLFAKAKVAPVSPPTLARLELQAAVLASKWLEFVVNESRLQIGRVVCWTDSLTTWHWINSPSYRWKTYVANRVVAVQETARKLSVTWRHCPGTDNPADLVSRGVPPSALQESIWQHGPEWLLEESKWPETHVNQHRESEVIEVEARVFEVQSEPLEVSSEESDDVSLDDTSVVVDAAPNEEPEAVSHRPQRQIRRPVRLDL